MGGWPVQTEDTFQTPSQAYVLSQIPLSSFVVAVHLNGLLMTAGIDYTLAGKNLVFTRQSPLLMQSVLVHVIYWWAGT